LINLPFVDEISYLLPTFSTSGVGSTPGKSTKKIGVYGDVSKNVSYILNGGYSIYFSPMLSEMNELRADVNLSGRIALSSISLWNLDKSFIDLGRSESSAFSSEYHFLHYNASVSIEWHKFLKTSND